MNIWRLFISFSEGLTRYVNNMYKNQYKYISLYYNLDFTILVNDRCLIVSEYLPVYHNQYIAIFIGVCIAI